MQRIAGNTQWNGFNILDGTAGGSSATVNYQVGAGSGQTMSATFNTLYKTTWSASNAPAGTTAAANNASQSYFYALNDFSGVSTVAAASIADHTAESHHFFKFTVVDASSNEVDVLIRVTDEIKAAVQNGGALTITGNNAAVAYIDGGRTSLATVLDGTTGHTGISVRFGANNTGVGTNLGIQIFGIANDMAFSIKNNSLSLIYGEVSTLDVYDVSSATNAQSAVTELDALITSIAASRARYGAYLNRLEYAADNLRNVAQNTDASRSQIEDADYAAETSELARTQIIAQASTAMLAQANSMKQSVLSLLQ
jgi:flagellin